MPLIKPSRWTVEQYLTEEVDLWRDLAFLFVYWGGEVIDLVSGTRIADASNAARTITPLGVGIDHSGRLEFASFTPINPGAGGCAVLTVANPASSGTRRTLVVQRTGSNSNQLEIRANATLGSPTVSGAVLFIMSDGGVQGADAVAVLDGKFHAILGARDDDGTNTLWIDGIDQTSGQTNGTNTIDDVSATFVLGGLPGTTTINYLEDKVLDAGWNRALSDAEKELVGRDPFIMFRMRDEAGVVYAIAAAPPAGNPWYYYAQQAAG